MCANIAMHITADVGWLVGHADYYVFVVYFVCELFCTTFLQFAFSVQLYHFFCISVYCITAYTRI